jgi:hypothetical protein
LVPLAPVAPLGPVEPTWASRLQGAAGGVLVLPLAVLM